MFLKSLQWRLVSFFCLVTFCLIIPIGLYLNNRVENEYYTNFVDRVKLGFSKWNIGVDPDFADLTDAIENNQQLFMLNMDYRSYTITDKNGKCLATNDRFFSEDMESATNELLESDNFVQAMTGTEDNKKILESYDGSQFYDYAKPVGNFIVYFRYYKDDWAMVLHEFYRIILTSLAIALAIAFIVGYFLSKTITVPIGRLMNKARSIAAGDFDQVLAVNSNDEISKLTESFNNMAVSLKNTLTEVSSEKNKLETILNYMTDGIVAFDLEGRVIHINPAALNMFDDGEFDTFEEYAAKYGFRYSINDVLYLESKKPGETFINIDSKVIKVYFAVFTDEKDKPEGVIAVLQDITEQQRLENMRKEFVANVSHELRTPLTSIKSYTETLLDGAVDDREDAVRFLGVINSETDRMTRLVKDLLQLSRLDNQQMKWNMEQISFIDLVKSVVERMNLEAVAKRQVLECYVLGDIPDIEADYGRIEQVVFNLLSNAVKYTYEGGKVNVYIGRMHNEVYMKVIDTGIGIPDGDLPRIFERFYRVDKARSREMGGTGLGLSIAREIVEAHSGTISIKSEIGNGTEVTVRLPVTQECPDGADRPEGPDCM